MSTLKKLPSNKSFLSNLKVFINTHPFVTLFLTLIMISIMLSLIFILKKLGDSKKTEQQLLLDKIIMEGFQEMKIINYLKNLI